MMKKQRKFSVTVFLLCMVFSSLAVLPNGSSTAGAWGDPEFYIDGVWPTYGYSDDQSRNKHKETAIIPSRPVQEWATKLPWERYTMYMAGASIGPDGSTYIPFFGAGYHTGGVTALNADGNIKWHFKNMETEGLTPLVLSRKINNDAKTMLIFGSNRSMNAVYDDVENCRCCVEIQFTEEDYCNFTCLDENQDFHCENGEQGYEWRHRLYDVVGGMCEIAGQTESNTACGWNVDMESVPNPDYDPALPEDPKNPNSLPFLTGHLEVSATPLLSPDGDTVYFLISPENYIIALNTADGSVKWVLGEDSNFGWVGGGCQDTDLDWLVVSPVMLSDGDFVLGTGSGCLVRVHDNEQQDCGEVIAAYQRNPTSPIVGLTLDEENNLYVATQGLWVSHESFVYKITLDSLMSAEPSPSWVYRASRHLGIDRKDLPGIPRSPALVTDANGGKSLYFTVVDAGENNIKGDPDNGWLVKIDADNGPGVETPKSWVWIFPSFWMNYSDVTYTKLEVGGKPYPSINCTVDGNGKVYVHGGRNRPEQGKIICYNSNLGYEWSIDTDRGGFSEVALGDDYLIAVSHGSWFPTEWRAWLSGSEGFIFLFRSVPLELIWSVQSILDGYEENVFYPTVYKFSVP